tara:strand:- start:50 stop:478 length:429 start_codon:yes stop_codon:yes gene_type:complete
MKKILTILLVSVIMFGCNKEKIPFDELTKKGTIEWPVMYYQGELFNGIATSTSEKEYYEINYKDGKKDGVLRGWSSNNQLIFKRDYNQGIRVGENKKWYENGQLKVDGNYKDDERVGWWVRYDEDGEMTSEYNYEDDTRITH